MVHPLYNGLCYKISLAITQQNVSWRMLWMGMWQTQPTIAEDTQDEDNIGVEMSQS
jgi:hypothetical protein